MKVKDVVEVLGTREDSPHLYIYTYDTIDNKKKS